MNKTVAIQFFASMVQVFLLSLQTINVVNQNVAMIGITSIGISSMWMVNVQGALDNWRSRIALMVGGSIGAMASVPFHHFLKQLQI